jgi:hypothetical protein
VTEATIDLSKDNWFFGVRAYDAEGWRSHDGGVSAGEDDDGGDFVGVIEGGLGDGTIRRRSPGSRAHRGCLDRCDLAAGHRAGVLRSR